ncbi:MAG: methyltransferase [Alphaproteobacteria bacterium]|nr:methyltransferase [Alphaproteobacteria bacterium]
MCLAHPITDAKDTVATLTFMAPGQENPRFLSQAYTGGAARFEFAVEHHRVTIGDLRPHAGSFSLDQEGFAFRTVPTAVADLYDDVAVEGAYYAEIEALLKRELGAERVVIFDATRRSDGDKGAANKDGARATASRIHVDYTARSGPQRARDVFGDAQVDRLLAEGKRIVQVNVWRPIAGPVRRSPLTLADATTVAPTYLVATDQVFPDRIGEIYHLTHSVDQRWYYAPEMIRDEVLLIKGWDSLEDGRAQFTPHSAFTLPDEAGAAPRESIEVRAFAVIGWSGSRHDT